MSLKEIMQYRKCRSEFLKAKKWMEDNYDALILPDKRNADIRFNNVSVAFDESFSNLSIEEKENEKARNEMEKAGSLPMVEKKEGREAESPF